MNHRRATRPAFAACLLLVALLCAPVPLLAQLRWQEGTHYVRLPEPVRTAGVAAGKIEVAEVFSYGCVHCNRARVPMRALAGALPADAAMAHVHAAFAPGEAWPMFQRAFYTARALGIAEATHEQMFAAVWETHEIPLHDPKTGAIRRPLPTIADAAKFYTRVAGAKAANFAQTAASPRVEAEMRRADELIKAWRVGGTPTIVVNGRYRLDNSRLASWDEVIQLVRYLVGLERARLGAAAPARR